MFDINYVELFRGIPPQVATMLIAMLPIAELRLAIPTAVAGYDMTIAQAYFWSVIGNLIPVMALVFFLEKVSTFLSRKYAVWDRFFKWLFARTHKRAKDKIEKYGPWGLFFFVAIPLPVTGGWTGAVAAFIFGIKKRQSMPAIFLGILAAGVIVSILTVMGVNFLTK